MTCRVGLNSRKPSQWIFTFCLGLLILIGPNSSSFGIVLYAAADMYSFVWGKKDLEGGTRQKKAWQFKRSSETGTGFICLDETTTCCNIHGVDEDDNKWQWNWKGCSMTRERDKERVDQVKLFRYVWCFCVLLKLRDESGHLCFLLAFHCLTLFCPLFTSSFWSLLHIHTLLHLYIHWNP